MKRVQCSGRVDGGSLVLSRDRWVDSELGELEGEAVFVTIDPIGDRRSMKANRFYWGCLLKAIADYTGETPENLHEHFKAMFLSEEHFLTLKTGELIDTKTITKSTTRLRVMEFSEYCMKIQVWAGEFLHLTIPEVE